jgi:hypothetical protein
LNILSLLVVAGLQVEIVSHQAGVVLADCELQLGFL